MIVCIAEKPSVARDIADVLGARERKDGYIEGNGYQVTWTFGHLCTLKEPHEYTPQWKTWSLGSLPMIPPRFGIKLIAEKSIEHQFEIIEKLFRQADEIINCGDAGQEGELIQRWVMLKSGAHCPVKRLWISSLTEEAIREGFKNIKDESEYQSLYEAGLSRAIGDWLLGMNATRLYTIKYGSGGRGSVLSIGRVQTPTLALIVNRQKEIDHFKPEQYWELKTIYRETLFTALKSRFTNKEEGLSLLNKIRESLFSVTDVTIKEGTEMPPRLFDLTSLQVECNKRYGYSADDTLKTIQSLYEKKYTTYPRVDTTFLSDDIYPKCPAILGGLRDYEVFTSPLKGTKLLKRKKVFDTSKVTDHHAIIPTGQYPQGLSEMERQVYDMVARHFIAVFYPDCKFSSTTVMGESAQIQFKATGKQILSPGWRAVIIQNNTEKNDEEEKTLPSFVKGESGAHQPDLAEKWTQPPKYYTEATLLRAMETAGKLVEDDELRDALKENGIGRPSTRAAIIETLYKRHYVRKERKNLLATPTGIELIDLIHEDLLKSVELTGIWEKKLRGIEKKTYDARTFLDELKKMVCELVNAVLSDNANRHIATAEASPAKEIKKMVAKKRSNVKKATKELLPDDSILGHACPLCGKGIIIKGKTAYGCSEWQKGCLWRLPFKKN